MPQHDGVEAVMRQFALAALWMVAAALVARPALAVDRAIQDIRFAKQAGVASAEIQFACPVEYLSHSPEAGVELRIRVQLGADCLATFGSGIRSELYDPPGGNLAGIRGVVFDTAEGRIGTLSMQLSRVASFRVMQGRLRNVVRVELGAPVDSEPTTAEPPSAPLRSTAPAPRPSAPPVTAPAPAEPLPPSAPAAPPSNRTPLRLVQRPAERAEKFTIQLAAGESVAQQAVAVPHERVGATLYINENTAGARQWQELRLGFFDSEPLARARLDALRAAYPDAVIAVADIAEQDRAAASALGETHAADDGAVGEPRDAPVLSAERIAALAAEADDAMLSQNYDRAVQIYTRLLEEPSFAERRAARERLGIARERKGQRAQAKHEYEAYLAEFGDGADAERVRQRLAGLVAVAGGPREVVAAETGERPRYEFFGGVAQYYRRDVYTPLEDRPESDEQAAILSNVDLSLRRHGDRFELQSRINAAYSYNLLDETRSSAPADQLYVSNAFVDIADRDREWSARLGRQTVYGSGIFGRFDGLHADYQWRPKVGFSLELGRPVEYPRHALDAHRQFAAFSADLERLVRDWDFSFYSLAQQIDGIADRQALGAEARYRGAAWNVVAALDADPSYGVLNSALVSANWRVRPKLTLNGRINVGTAPFLTTRNALIGQTVGSLDELLDVYSEGQLRRLARDRTGQVRNGSLGLARPVFDRFQLNADVSVYDFESTLASGGVDAVPDNRQTSLYLSFVGSSVIKHGDTTVFSLRHTNSTTGTGDTLVADFRFAVTSRLRLSPRLALSQRTYKRDGSEQRLVAPMLRVAYRWPRGHQFDLEVGTELSNRDFLPTDPTLLGQPTEESSAYFVNAGYWWEF